MSQEDKILEFLKQGNSITPIEALEKFGCFRLSGRIYDLRHKKKLNIQSQLIEKNGKHFEQYWLIDEPAPTEQEQVLKDNYQARETRINLKEVAKQMMFVGV